MVLNHVWGLVSRPNKEWHAIAEEKTSIGHIYLTHVLLLALIPATCAYFGTTTVGWTVGVGEPVKLTTDSALYLFIAFYFAMVVGVFVLGLLVHWMSKTYGANPDLSKGVMLAAFTATPLFLAGFIGLYPNVWISMLVGLMAVAYTGHLLYTGVPILMNISEDRGFLFSSAVLGVGLVMMVGMLGATVILWDFGLMPVFTG